MRIEIQKPELERRVRESVQSGHFHDVESVPGKLSGAWVFRDTRLPISTVFGNLEDGATIDEIAAWFRISKERVIAVLDFAARSAAAPATLSGRDAHSV